MMERQQMHRHVPLYTFAASVERQFYMRPQTIFQEKEKCAATQRRHTNRRAAAERPSKKKTEDIRNVVMSLRAPVRPPPPLPAHEQRAAWPRPVMMANVTASPVTTARITNRESEGEYNRKEKKVF
jgi:hypothetical protein